MTTFCHKCGKPLPADDTFCSGCGTPRKTESEAQAAAPDQPPAPQPTPPSYAQTPPPSYAQTPPPAYAQTPPAAAPQPAQPVKKGSGKALIIVGSVVLL